jgi:hypothetical protein
MANTRNLRKTRAKATEKSMSKKNIKHLKLPKLLIMIILIFIIYIGLIYIFYYSLAVYKVVEYDVYLIVGNKIGFDLSTEYIHFGIVPPNGSSTKNVFIYNNEDKKLKLQLKLEGNVSQFVYVKDFSPTIMPHENKTLTFYAIVPGNASYGNYSGKLKIIFRRF